ncbi:MAG: NAD kinase [Actinomycetaceae bacterium]|nr:NAD kinase [Actinomycetaceae bacterium]
MSRRIHIFQRSNRPSATSSAQLISKKLADYGIQTVDTEHVQDAELVIVLGGDGTILAAAEQVRHKDIPLIGVNLGHVGFLAEAEEEDLNEVIEKVAKGDYTIDRRMTLDVELQRPDGSRETDWALNDAAVLGTDRSRPVVLELGVDGSAVSEYGADGLIISTPTGSTAYSFSAGGPIIFPNVEAVEVVPLAAHGLFTRPIVVGPDSYIEVKAATRQLQDMDVWCDGRRRIQGPPGSVLRAVCGQWRLSLIRLNDMSFSGRLVAKFNLPVEGWRKDLS